MLISVTLLVGTALGWSQGAQTLMKEKARGFRTNSVTRGADPTGGGRYGYGGGNGAGRGGAVAQPRPAVAPPQMAPKPAPEEEKPLELPGPQAAAARKLNTSLNHIKSDASADQTQALVNALLGAALGSRQPTLASVTRLAGDLADSWPHQKLGEREREQFSQYIVCLFNSADISDSQTQRVLQKTEKLLQNSGMSGTEAQAILSSVRSIQNQTKR